MKESKVNAQDMKKPTLHDARAVKTASFKQKSEDVKVSLYATRPAAGFPSPGDDSVERSLDINELLVTHPSATFFVRVEGDSMEGARIYSGDVLVVDRSIIPSHNMIVVASVYGEMVIKRLVKTPLGHTLVSENDAYAPILVSENDDCTVWGVVVGSVRTFR